MAPTLPRLRWFNLGCAKRRTGQKGSSPLYRAGDHARQIRKLAQEREAQKPGPVARTGLLALTAPQGQGARASPHFQTHGTACCGKATGIDIPQEGASTGIPERAQRGIPLRRCTLGAAQKRASGGHCLLLLQTPATGTGALLLIKCSETRLPAEAPSRTPFSPLHMTFPGTLESGEGCPRKYLRRGWT